MRLTKSKIRSIFRSIYDNRNSFQGLFAVRKELNQMLRNANKKQLEVLYQIDYYFARKLGDLLKTIVAKDKTYELNEVVTYYTIFGAGGVGIIHKGAKVKILEAYNDKIVVGCGNEALDVPFESCLTPKHPNFDETTFKEVA